MRTFSPVTHRDLQHLWHLWLIPTFLEYLPYTKVPGSKPAENHKTNFQVISKHCIKQLQFWPSLSSTACNALLHPVVLLSTSLFDQTGDTQVYNGYTFKRSSTYFIISIISRHPDVILKTFLGSSPLLGMWRCSFAEAWEVAFTRISSQLEIANTTTWCSLILSLLCSASINHSRSCYCSTCTSSTLMCPQSIDLLWLPCSCWLLLLSPPASFGVLQGSHRGI